ncbi:MAG: filamentous hemagglutinin N-terminal domain-containing protein [Pseudomonadales bacterium]|jgi:filamentous hemagglutinin|nr:filamentous hemagglutinin N-terminal domain-containing protein [Pseudomonadales bacterium]
MNQFLYRLVFNKIRGLLMAVGTAGMNVAQAQIFADPQAPGTQQAIVLMAGNGVPLVNIQTPSDAGVSRNVYRQFDIGTQGVILNNARTATATQLGGYVAGNPWLATGTAKVILNEVNASTPSQLQGLMEVGGDRAEVVIANPAGLNCDGCGVINANRLILSSGAPVLSGGSLDSYRVRGGMISVNGAGLEASSADYTALISRAVEVNAGLWANALDIVTGVNDITLNSTDTAQVTPRTGTSLAPVYGLDVAALGGMYAGKIILVGTEAGVGVRNAGDIGASAGQIRLTADGWIENSGRMMASMDLDLSTPDDLINSGTLYAEGNAQLDIKGNLDNSGLLQAQGEMPVNVGGHITNSGTLNAIGNAPITAGGNLDNSGLLQAQGEMPVNVGGNVTNSGVLYAVGSAPITAGGNLDNSGQLQSQGEMPVNVGGNVTNSGALYAVGNTPITAGGNLDNSGLLQSQGELPVDIDGSLTNSGIFLANGSVPLSIGGNFTNSGTLQATGDTPVTVGGAITNNGAFITAGTAWLNANNDITNTTRGTLYAAGDARLTTLGTIDNHGLIAAQGNTLLLATGQDSTITSHVNAVIGAGIDEHGRVNDTGTGNLFLNATALVTAQGQNLASGDLSLTSARIDVSQSQSAANNVFLNAITDDVNASGAKVSAAQTLNVSTPKTLRTDDARVTAAYIQVAADTLSNFGGTVLQTGTEDLSLHLFDLDNQNGTLATAGALNLEAAIVVNQGGTLTADTLRVQTSSLLENHAGLLAATHDLEIRAASVQNDAGRLGSVQGFLTLTTRSGTLDNTAGLVQAGQTLTLNTQGVINTEGLIAGRDVAITTPDIGWSWRGPLSLAVDNSYGVIVALDTLDVLTGAVNNDRGGLLQAGGTLRLDTQGHTLSNRYANDTGGIVSLGAAVLRTGTLDNIGGVIVANDTLNVVSDAMNNYAGLVQASGLMTLDTQGHSLSNRALGRIVGQSAITLRSGNLDNLGGMIVAARTLDMLTGAANNATGLIQAGGALTFDTQDQALDNRNAREMEGGIGGIWSLDTITLRTGTLDNGAGMIVAASTLDMLTRAVNNDAGLLQAGGALTLDTQGEPLSNRNSGREGGIIGMSTVTLRTGDLDNTRGVIAAAKALTLKTLNLTNEYGTLQAGGYLSLDTQGYTLENHSGWIWAQQGLELHIRSLENHAGFIGSGGSMSLITGLVSNDGGTLQAVGTLMLDTRGQALDNPYGVIMAGDTLRLNTGLLNNLGGFLQAGGIITISTGHEALINRQLGGNGGIWGQRMVTLYTPYLDNSGGFLGSDGTLNLHIEALNNAGGTLYTPGNIYFFGL